MFLIGAVVLAAVVGFFVSRSQKGVITPQVSLQPNALEELSVSPIPNAATTTEFEFSLSPVEFPATLPSYRMSSGSPFAIGEQLATQLGVTAPHAVVGSKKTIRRWQNGETIVTAQTSPPAVSVRFPASSAGALPTLAEAEQIVRSFLIQYALINPNVAIQTSSAAYLQSETSNFVPLLGPEGANKIQLELQYALDSVPIIQPSGVRLGISAIVGRGGAIESVSVSAPPLAEQQAAVSVVPLPVAQAALVDGHGALLGITKGTGEESITDIQISAVNVTYADIRYLWSPDKQLALPVFVFTGLVTGGSEESTGATVIYITPATP